MVKVSGIAGKLTVAANQLKGLPMIPVAIKPSINFADILVAVPKTKACLQANAKMASATVATGNPATKTKVNLLVPFNKSDESKPSNSDRSLQDLKNFHSVHESAKIAVNEGGKVVVPTTVQHTPLQVQVPIEVSIHHELMNQVKAFVEDSGQSDRKKTTPTDGKKTPPILETPPTSPEVKNSSRNETVVPQAMKAVTTERGTGHDAPVQPIARNLRKGSESPASGELQRTSVKDNSTGEAVKSVVPNLHSTASQRVDKMTLQAATPTAKATPAQAVEFLNKLGGELKQRIQDGERIVEIAVMAPHYGKLLVELTEHDGAMSAVFYCDSPQLREQLQHDRESINAMLPPSAQQNNQVIVSDQPPSSRQFSQTSQHSSGHSQSSFSGNGQSKSMAQFLFNSEPVVERRTWSPYATREWIG